MKMRDFQVLGFKQSSKCKTNRIIHMLSRYLKRCIWLRVAMVISDSNKTTPSFHTRPPKIQKTTTRVPSRSSTISSQLPANGSTTLTVSSKSIHITIRVTLNCQVRLCQCGLKTSRLRFCTKSSLKTSRCVHQKKLWKGYLDTRLCTGEVFRAVSEGWRSVHLGLRMG